MDFERAAPPERPNDPHDGLFPTQYSPEKCGAIDRNRYRISLKEAFSNLFTLIYEEPSCAQIHS